MKNIYNSVKSHPRSRRTHWTSASFSSKKVTKLPTLNSLPPAPRGLRDSTIAENFHSTSLTPMSTKSNLGFLVLLQADDATRRWTVSRTQESVQLRSTKLHSSFASEFLNDGVAEKYKEYNNYLPRLNRLTKSLMRR